MKKIITGIMAFILIGTMLTGCGMQDEFAENAENTVSEETAVETEEISEQIDDTAETVQEDNSPETEIDTAVSDDDQKQSDSYEDALRAYFDAQNNKDYDQIARLIYPDEIVDGLYAINELGAEAFAAEIEALSADLDVTYEVTEIIEEEAIPDEALEELVSTFDRMLKVIHKVDEYGGNSDLTDEQTEEIFNIMYDTEETADHVYTATEGYDVTVSYLKNGEPDKDYFYVYYINGEGWKLNNSMRKYIEKSKQAMANANAKNVFAAYMTAFIELDAEGMEINGSYLISSDESRNIHLPESIDQDKLNEYVDRYFYDAEEFNYFLIMHNGSCIYTVAEPKDGTGQIGTYPPKSILTEDFETEEVAELEYSFDELYEMAKNLIP